MNIKITFKKQDGAGKEKTVSKTFTNVNKQASNENFLQFAEAYMGLTDIKQYEVTKITTESIN